LTAILVHGREGKRERERQGEREIHGKELGFLDFTLRNGFKNDISKLIRS
jgi:hypothetical protein